MQLFLVLVSCKIKGQEILFCLVKLHNTTIKNMLYFHLKGLLYAINFGRIQLLEMPKNILKLVVLFKIQYDCVLIVIRMYTRQRGCLHLAK